MSQHELLNNIDHQGLKVIREYSGQYGDNLSHTVAVISEFRQLQRFYPLVFRKNSQTAQFEPIALLGFADGENLFIDEPDQIGQWQADYIPLTMQRRPFLIGFQQSSFGEPGESSPVVHIDMASAKVSQTDGEPLFLAQGGNTPLLDYISSVLLAIYQGGAVAQTFVQTLLQFELIEPFTLKVGFVDDSQTELVGFYTINEERLAQLDGQVLQVLHQQGFLEACYMMLASLGNIEQLISVKNRRLNRARCSA